MQKEKIRNQAAISQEDVYSDYSPKEYVQRKSLTQLVYKGLDNVKTINKMQYEQVLKSYPLVANLYAAVKKLCAIIYSKHSYELEPWLAKMEKFNIQELQTYINGIRCDIDVVKKGIKLQYNNGLAEGSVNKSYKRVMYGRNSFELLKAKVLLNEYFYTKFN